MKELQTADEFFAPKQDIPQSTPITQESQTNSVPANDGGLPTADDFFKPQKPSIAVDPNPVSSPAIDEFFQKKPVGRIMSAFGSAFAEGGQGGALGIEPGGDVENALKKYGIFNDYSKGQSDIGKAFSEALIRPAAVVLDNEFRGAQAAMGAIGAGVEQTASEIENTSAYKSADVLLQKATHGYVGIQGGLSSAAEYFMTTPAGMEVHAIPPDILHARSVGAIGESESSYFGLKEPTPEEALARQHAAEMIPVETLPEAPKDIHAIAREVAPETFEKYDALNTQQDTIRTQIADLAANRDEEMGINPPHADELQDVSDKIDTILGKVNNVESRLTKRQTANLEDLRTQFDDLSEKSSVAAGADTPEMADLRSQIQQLDYAKRDIAPDVTAAYREAQNRMPEEKATEEAQPIEEKEPTISEEPATEPTKPIEEQLQSIKDDVSKKLTDVGRPAEESQAASELIAQHYKAIADQGWAKGTPEEIYQRDAANIVAGKERVRKGAREFAQDEKPLKTDTPEFKKWFGDSKIVTSQGKPQVVYHGTNKDFNAFDTSLNKRNMQGDGIYFTRDPNLANHYAAGKGANVIPAYIKMENPLVATSVNEAVEKLKDKGINIINEEFTGVDASDLKKILEKGGYDGLDIGGNIVVQDSTQIKSIHNRGTFEPNNPNILEQKARGKIRLATDDAKAAITLFKSADASTFIHETGHHWLDEMMRYAKEDDAPATLLKDRDTVNQWLGVKDGEEITRAQHEKFARGFERYLMEGTAPSKELANVFAKFKQWLTDIYQTVQRLKSPITDDIRDVFDRLLSANPERTVIAPEREMPTGKTLAEESRTSETASIQPLAEGATQPESLNTEGRPPSQTMNPAEATGSSNQGVLGGGSIAETTGRTAAEIGAPKVTPEEKRNLTDNPNANLPKAESKFVDKAGNIRLDTLNTSEDVNQMLRDIANENDQFLNATRGVVSDTDVMDLADAMGVSANEVNIERLRQMTVEDGVPLAARVMALRKTLIQSATELRESMSKAAEGTEADLLAYAEARERHIMIQETLHATTAEVGRALRAFHKLEGMAETQALGDFLKQTTGKDLFQLQREARVGSSLDTPQKISQFIQDSRKPTFNEWIREYWVNINLSSPVTHAKNIIGNLMVTLNSVAETAIASKIGEVLKSEDRIYMEEAKDRFFGIMQGATEGMSVAAKILKDENYTSGSHTVENYRVKAISGKKGEIIRIPTRLLSAEDEIFKAIAYRQELNALARRAARKEGLAGDAANARMVDILQRPTEGMMNAAIKNAEYQTFTNSLGPTGRAIQNFASSNLAAFFIFPFVRTPINILKYAGERTPFGFLSKEIRENMSGRAGTIARDTQMARMAFGTTIAAAGTWLFLQGRITSGGPSDPKEKAAMRMIGWQPYSIKIGNMYYSYEWLDPISTIMGTTADMTDIYQRGHLHDEGGEKIAATMVASLSKNLISKASLRGASEFLNVAMNGDQYGDKYMQNFAASFIPSVARGVAQTNDPVLRESRTVIDAMKAKIPGLKETLFPRRDIWGNPIITNSLGPDIISPIRMSAISQDPVNQRLMLAGYFPSKLDRKIRGVELTDKQYDDYSKLAGNMAKMRLDQYVAIPQTRDLPPEIQQKTIKSIVDGSRETARTIIMMNNPDIYKQAAQNKINALTGKK